MRVVRAARSTGPMGRIGERYGSIFVFGCAEACVGVHRHQSIEIPLALMGLAHFLISPSTNARR